MTTDYKALKEFLGLSGDMESLGGIMIGDGIGGSHAS